MSKLLSLLHERVPHFNPLIAEGVAVDQAKNALEYIDNAFKMSAMHFPPQLKYEGYKKCTPEEEYNVKIKKRHSKQVLELSKSSTYLVNFYFSWEGHLLEPKPIFVPFLEKGGQMMIRGKTFTVLPILADPTMSVAKSANKAPEIFIPFLAAKITFHQMSYPFGIDGSVSAEYLVWSRIHNHNPNKQPRRSKTNGLSNKVVTSIPHYLFCKYGVHKVFKQYCGTDIIIIDGEVDRTIYPEEEWAVCSSLYNVNRNAKRPRGFSVGYQPNHIKILVPKKDIKKDRLLGMLCGFFYVVDHFPNRILAEYFDGTEDETRLWRVLLGQIIFKNKDSEGELYNKINDHMQSLDNYLDDMTREGLEEDGYAVDNLYDLMAILVSDFISITINTDSSSMYGKVLAVNRYLLADIVKAISIFKYKIIGIKNRELSEVMINRLLNRFLRPDIVLSNQKSHNEINTIQCAGDNIMFNFTSKAILQDKATGVQRKKRTVNYKDPSKLLHVSIAVAGSILVLPKTEPTGRTTINPYLTMQRDYKIKCPDNLLAVSNYIQKKIEGH